MSTSRAYPTLRERLSRYARDIGVSRAVKGGARKLGFDVVGKHYYSPIPDLSGLPHHLWEDESELLGVRFDSDAGLEFARRDLAPFLAEYDPPRQPTGYPRDFYLENGFYGSVDAELLYAVVRHVAPRRVVELGSGASTLVIADARARNQRADSDHRVFDPFPRPELVDVLSGVAELHRVPATEIALDEFLRLEAGDVLFVDTTHTVKIGSEVNRIILEILPVLSPGVFVHFHDIFLPWEYPRELLDLGFFWAEQYLLQAFLSFNDSFEILLSAHALHRRYPDEVNSLVRSAPANVDPSSFWLRRVA
jgi:hypothetical protein